MTPALEGRPQGTKAEFDPQKVGYLVKDEDRPELEAFIRDSPVSVSDYIPVAIIGEGTAAARTPRQLRP